MSTPFRIVMTGLVLVSGLAVAACEEKQEAATTTGTGAGETTGTAETTPDTGATDPAQTSEEADTTGN
jgi:hypothetical protein